MARKLRMKRLLKRCDCSSSKNCKGIGISAGHCKPLASNPGDNPILICRKRSVFGLEFGRGNRLTPSDPRPELLEIAHPQRNLEIDLGSYFLCPEGGTKYDRTNRRNTRLSRYDLPNACARSRREWLRSISVRA